MRSRADAVLRVVALAAIVAWILNAAVPRAGSVVTASERDLGDALPRWTRDAAVQGIHVRLRATPDAASSAWLAALRRAGTQVTWSGDALAPLALEAYPAADPAGGTILLASADSGIMSDALGALDTLRGPGVSITRLAATDGDLTLLSGQQSARIHPAESREPKALYVSGSAGWEAKFVVAALEEAGWKVDARIFVAPGVDVVQGASRAGPDTARHAAVILLDSAAAETVRGVESFVRAGGGAVLAGDASRARRVAALVAWRAGARESAPLGTLPGDSAWRGLSRVPLVLVSDAAALPLETRDDAAAVVARRHYAGRVVAVGYDATWRWRMAGGENSVAAHRAWWSRLVSSVAARPAVADGNSVTGAAPLGSLHDVLGPPSEEAAPRGSTVPRAALGNLLAVIALGALVSEWLLRRARGAR